LLTAAVQRLSDALPERLDNPRHLAGVEEIADIQPRRLGARGPDEGIQSEVAEHEVGPAVAVEIHRLDAVPPAVRAREAGLLGTIHEAAVLLVEYTNGHPFTDDDQVELAVAVVIDPRRRGDHAD